MSCFNVLDERAEIQFGAMALTLDIGARFLIIRESSAEDRFLDLCPILLSDIMSDTLSLFFRKMCS
jgi:hypothetical protein